jgi:hypothetical protein
MVLVQLQRNMQTTGLIMEARIPACPPRSPKYLSRPRDSIPPRALEFFLIGKIFLHRKVETIDQPHENRALHTHTTSCSWRTACSIPVHMLASCLSLLKFTEGPESSQYIFRCSSLML